MIRGRTAAMAAAATAGLVGVVGVAAAVGSAGAVAAPAGSQSNGAGALGADTATPATATDDATVQTAALSADAPNGGTAWRQLHRVLHGQVVVADGTGGATRTVDVQRGTVKAISPTSVTIQSPDTFTQSYVINADTKVRTGHGTESAVADIKTGDKAAVVAVQDGGNYVAKRVVTRPPA